MAADNLYLGTCSWKYPSWHGLVYSAPEPENYLEEYARVYNTVEVDQWFWSLFPGAKIKLPEEKTVHEYAESVPEDFRFTVKVPNSITLTHYYQRHKGEGLEENPQFLSPELFARFMETMDPLKGKIGALIFQFEYLNKAKMAGLPAFLEKMERFFDAVPRDVACLVETRNQNYLRDEYFSFLNRMDLGHVFLQGYYMPDITETYLSFQGLIRKMTMLRLHGYERDDMEKRTGKKWDRIIENRDDDLKNIAAMVRDLLGRKIVTYLNVNNHYEGSAPLTIKKLEALLAG
jgi:uncharacterized protein YecE (DUF72 family)